MRHEFITAGTEWIAVSSTSVGKAERCLVACEACSPLVSRPFGSVLGEVLGAENGAARYILCAPAECPSCNTPILENTLVRCEGDVEGMRSVAATSDERAESRVVLIDEALLAEATGYVSGCENCMGDVGIAFDYILDAVTGSTPMLTEYVLCHPARCPSCFHHVTEKTLVVLSSTGQHSA
jgi:hypothetical protein